MRGVRGALGVVAAVLLLPAAGCSDGGDDDAYVLELDGAAEVRAGDEWRNLSSGDHELAEGDEVRLTDGDAVLELPGEGSLELRAGDAAIDGSRVELRPVPLLLDGDALVVAGDDVVQLVAGRADVSMRQGVARVRRSSSVTVAAYRGTADVEALDRSLPGGLPAYRQVTVPDTGALPRRPVPVVYDGDDPHPWDQRYLGEAIDLDRQFRTRSRALERDLGPRASGDVDVELLGVVLPEVVTADGFDDRLLEARRSVPETVTGASIVLASSGDFTARWRSTFGFRADGAEWGLVALDQEARRERLLRVLDGAVSAAFALTEVGGGDGTLVAAPPPAPSPGDGGPPPTSPTPPPSSPPPTTPPPEQDPGPGPDPDDPGPTPTMPPPPEETDPVESIVESLLGPSPEGDPVLLDEVVESLLGGS